MLLLVKCHKLNFMRSSDSKCHHIYYRRRANYFNPHFSDLFAGTSWFIYCDIYRFLWMRDSHVHCHRIFPKALIRFIYDCIAKESLWFFMMYILFRKGMLSIMIVNRYRIHFDIYWRTHFCALNEVKIIAEWGVALFNI